MAQHTEKANLTGIAAQHLRWVPPFYRPCCAALSLAVVLTASSFVPALAANADSVATALSVAELSKQSDSLQHGSLAALPIEVVDAQHRLQVLPIFGAVVGRLADRKVYCRDMPIDDTLHNIRCTQTDPHEGVADFALLTKVENGRLLVVSTFDSGGESVEGKPALELLYLAATGASPPSEVMTVPQATTDDSRKRESVQQTAPADHCLWTFVHNQKVDMGSTQQLDAFIQQIGGQCVLDATKEENATLTCRFPDSRTGRIHELALTADDDQAGCYAITHTQLDGRTLPYAQYMRIFIEHR